MNRDARNTVYAQLYEEIRSLKRPLVVGINGAYTSGKTTFTLGLQQYLRGQGAKTQVIHYDDFHHPFSAIAWTDDTEVEVFYNKAFDPAKLEREILGPLKEHAHINKDVVCVDLGTSQFTNTIHVDIDETTIVLLEGVLLFRPPLMEYIDFKVYLDISFEEMLKRAKLRDVPKFGEGILEKFVTRYIPVQQRYMAECGPVAAGDIVIDNNDHQAPVVKG